MPTVSHVILASGSPRRRELLEAACLQVTVRPSGVDETWPGGSLESGAVTLAQRKLDEVGSDAGLTIAADTVVAVGASLLGKPADAAEAVAMLQRLSGRDHVVVTGFCVAQGEHALSGAVNTRVWFRDLSRAEIDRYVDSGDPFDKAGAYAIQAGGGAFVDRVEGSYTNVVGLPLREVLEAIAAVARETGA